MCVKIKKASDRDLKILHFILLTVVNCIKIATKIQWTFVAANHLNTSESQNKVIAKKKIGFVVLSIDCICSSYMTRKLFAFAKGECAAESADNPMFQELLLGGQLYGMILKVRYCQIHPLGLLINVCTILGLYGIILKIRNCQISFGL